MKRALLVSLAGVALASCGAPPGEAAGVEAAGVETKTSAVLAPCNPPSYYECADDPHKIQICNCITPPPPAVTGTVVPNFYITHVVYAPPGKMSSIAYSKSTSVGSTTTATKSFKTSNTVTADTGVSVMGSGADASLSLGKSWGTTDTQSTDAQFTYTQGYKEGGQVDGINHDDDEIWFLVKPIINMTIQPTNSGTQFVKWQFSANQDGVNNAIKYWAKVGWLTGHVPMPSDVKSNLDYWGITADYYSSLLMADPFAWGNVPNEGMDPNRFDFIGEFPYEPLNNGASPSTQTFIVDQKMTNSSTTQSDLSYTVSVSLGGSVGFGSVYKAGVKDTVSWTWSSSSSTKESTGTGSTDTLIIAQPSFGYTGPTLLHVWEDKIYKTYAFTLDNPVGQPMQLGPSTKETYTMGDFNGDGKMDMIVASSTGSVGSPGTELEFAL